MKTIKATLCFLVDKGFVLFGKKTKKIGVGLWNGAGGSVEDGESVIDATIRETLEELGIEVDRGSLEQVALCYFHNISTDGSYSVVEVHVFTAKIWNGQPQETVDGGLVEPTWFSKKCLPVEQMMLADKTWIPLVLCQDKKVVVRATYTAGQQALIGEVDIREVTLFEQGDV